MTQRRLSTVYDYANLRLHPDGRRVYQKADNVRPHLVKITSQGPRASWIARDAGGSGKVSRFRRRKKLVEDASEEPGEEIDLDGDGIKVNERAEGIRGERRKGKASSVSEEDQGEEQGEEGLEESDDEGIGGKRKLTQHDKRKLKRQKFAADFDYLQEAQSLPVDGPGSQKHSNEADNSGVTEQGLPGPSPDLLKSIHRFAAEFYTEKGQLLNISREYRKERKLRKLQKLGKLGKQSRRSKAHRSGSSAGSSTRDVSEDQEYEGSSKEVSEEEDFDDQDGDEEDANVDVNVEENVSDEDEDNVETKSSRKDVKGKAKAKAKRARNPRSKKLYTDMYKMFDGSAILAIGMLVQEMIAHMVDNEMPMEWKEEMEQVYGSRNDNADDQLEDKDGIGVASQEKDRQTNIEKEETETEQDQEEQEDEEEEDDQEDDDEEDEDEEDDGKPEGVEEREDEDEDEEDEDDAITRESRIGSPPVTQGGDVSSYSDVDMKTGSDLETHDEDESDDEGD